MMNLLAAEDHPYRRNPLIVLNVEASMKIDVFEAQCGYVAACIRQGLPLESQASLILQPGDGQAAAAALAQPVLRLLCDCMKNGFPVPSEST